MLPLEGALRSVTLAGAFDRSGTRLFCVEEDIDPHLSPSWRRLLLVDPASLTVEWSYPLLHEVRRVVVEPAGRSAYRIAGPHGPWPSVVMHLDLTSGTARPLVTVPGRAMDLAVTADKLFVVHPSGNEVWALDRRTGRLLLSIPVGKGPVGIALSSH